MPLTRIETLALDDASVGHRRFEPGWRCSEFVGPILDTPSASRAIGVAIRVGVHTGEVELVGADVRGIAVHVAARVPALAGPDEVLLTTTTADLVDGSGLQLENAGAHELKGLGGTREIWRVAPG